MKKILIGFVLFSIFCAIVLPKRSDQTSGPAVEASSTAESAASAKPALPALSKKERDELIALATKSFRVDRDKMEAVTFYTPRGANMTQTRFDSYLSIPDGRGAIFRVILQYTGDDWVFYEKVKVMADDQIVYEKNFAYRDVVRDNSGGTVWETVDFAASPSDIAALREIAESKSATIRFSGRERQKDHNLSKGEFERLKATLKAYKELAPLRT